MKDDFINVLEVLVRLLRIHKSFVQQHEVSHDPCRDITLSENSPKLQSYQHRKVKKGGPIDPPRGIWDSTQISTYQYYPKRTISSLTRNTNPATSSSTSVLESAYVSREGESKTSSKEHVDNSKFPPFI